MRTPARPGQARARSASSTNARGDASRVCRKSAMSRRRRLRIVTQPHVGHERDALVDRGLRALGETCVGLGDRARGRQQHVVCEHRHGLVHGVCERPLSVQAEEGRPVVDQPRPPVPDQQVRVAVRAVDVGHEGVEPDDVGGEAGIDRALERKREGQRARQEVHAEVRAGARVEQLLDVGIGLGASHLDGDLDDREVGDEQPEPSRELARDDLGDERRLALSGSSELRDVHAVVRRLDEAGHRAALPQRGDVARRAHAGQRSLEPVLQARAHGVEAFAVVVVARARRPRDRSRRVRPTRDLRRGRAGWRPRARRAGWGSRAPRSTARAGRARHSSPPGRAARGPRQPMPRRRHRPRGARAAMAPNASSSVSANQSAAARMAPALAPFGAELAVRGQRAGLLDERGRERGDRPDGRAGGRCGEGCGDRGGEQLDSRWLIALELRHARTIRGPAAAPIGSSTAWRPLTTTGSQPSSAPSRGWSSTRPCDRPRACSPTSRRRRTAASSSPMTPARRSRRARRPSARTGRSCCRCSPARGGRSEPSPWSAGRAASTRSARSCAQPHRRSRVRSSRHRQPTSCADASSCSSRSRVSRRRSSRAETLDLLLPEVVTRLAGLLHAPLVQLYLLEEAEGRLRLRAAAPPSTDAPSLVSLRAGGRRGERLDAGTTLAQALFGAGPGASSLLVPLIVDGALLGFLAARAAPDRVFDEEARDLATSIASQTAVAIRKIQLIERLTERNQLKDFFEDLGRGIPDGLVARGRRLGVDLERAHLVLWARRFGDGRRGRCGRPARAARRRARARAPRQRLRPPRRRSPHARAAGCGRRTRGARAAARRAGRGRAEHRRRASRARASGSSRTRPGSRRRCRPSPPRPSCRSTPRP